MSNFLNSQSFRSCNMLATRLKEPSCVYSIIICLSCACTPEQQHQVQQLLEQERGEGGERERERERRESGERGERQWTIFVLLLLLTRSQRQLLLLHCNFIASFFIFWGSTRWKHILYCKHLAHTHMYIYMCIRIDLYLKWLLCGFSLHV